MLDRSRSTTILWAVLAPLVAWAPLASAQVDLTRPDPIADELADVRIEQQDQRRGAGVALLSSGLGSAIAGGAVMGSEGERDPFLLGFGFGTAVWGVTNAILALFMLDLDGGGFRGIEQDRGLRGDELAALREGSLRSQHTSTTVFAFNAGLDLFYAATGVLMFFLADRLDTTTDQDLLRGYAVSQITQGGLLLVFDLLEWGFASVHADRIAAIARPR